VIVIARMPFCIYTEGVECQLSNRHCERCGHNPVVAEMRKTALKMGDKHFLKYSERDYSNFLDENKGK